MKTFPSKVEWIAQHKNGDKCYYYPGIGWISAHDGLVTGFDLTDVQAAPDDATHVQIVNGKVQYIRCVEASVCVDIWRSGWQQACTLSKLKGTVVRIADGSVLGGPPVPKAVYNWVDVSDGLPTEGTTRTIECQFENGASSFGTIADFNFGGAGAQLSVKRWRYAS